MKHYVFLLCLAILSASHKVTAAFINSQRGTTANQQQKIQQPLIISTAADAAIALNSIAFMNSLCRRKNTADVRTFTQSITASSSMVVVHPKQHDVATSVHNSNNESCIERKKQSASKDDDDTLPVWTLVNVFFRNEKQQHCPQEKLITSPETTTAQRNNNNSKLHTQPTTTSHKTVAEYMGKLWFLPKDKGTIQFRETIRIVSLGLDGGTSTVECLTEYFNGKGEWVDCSRVLCHFSSLDMTYDEVKRGEAFDVGSTADDDVSLLQSKVKMTLDCELLVWLPLPSVASKAVQKKISSVFEEIVTEFFGS
ncbi:hypothetical protein ACHAWT_004358 [Skeletonema menzelii]